MMRKAIGFITDGSMNRALLYCQRSQLQTSSLISNKFQRMAEGILKEIKKDEELKKNLEKLRQESAKLNESDSLKSAREKFDVITQKSLKSTEVIGQQLTQFYEQVSKLIEEAKSTEYGKKVSTATLMALENAKDAATTLSNTKAYKNVTESANTLKNELDNVLLADAYVYSKGELRMRSHYESFQTFEPNTEALGIDLHKEAKWSKSFKSWAEGSTVYSKILDWKIHYEESDNPLVRIGRFFTDKVSDIWTMSSSSELSEIMTEIHKYDPSFTQEEFVKFCQRELIPNVLEAYCQGQDDFLKDWCFEKAFLQMITPLKETRKVGYKVESKILDISRVDIITGKMVEQGPMLLIFFYVHMIECIRNFEGKILQGSPDQPIRREHLWALCRDIDDPRQYAAWKVLEITFGDKKMFI